MVDDTTEEPKGIGERVAVLETLIPLMAKDMTAVKNAVLGYNDHPGMITEMKLNEQRWSNHDKWARRTWVFFAGIFASMIVTVFGAAVWIGKVKIMETLGI